MPVTDEEIRDAIMDLLEVREPPKTICPSEAARALTAEGWRPLMQQVRTVAIALAKEGLVHIRQRGRTVSHDEPPHGPIRTGRAKPEASAHPTTPDGRYIVVRGRLWRKTNPHLPVAVREALVKQLMDARRALRGTRPEAERSALREQVEAAKRALGERGPVWWTDGAPDFNRKLAKNTPYRDWFSTLRD
jgi:hypothetical protein